MFVQSSTFRSLLVRVLCVILFAWLVGRFWDPYYGFTRFLQMDAATLALSEPVLREAPIYTYSEGYDGQFYAQFAARPDVNNPALAASVDNVGYRARRILLSWMAWAIARGDPVNAVRTYAWLNLAIWAGLAGLLWFVFPARLGWRGTLAWVGILFSAGAMFSVRLALTDLLALLLVAAAAVAMENKRPVWASALLGLGGLARETALLGAAALLPNEGRKLRPWIKAAGLGVLAALPLGAWVLYLRANEAGLGNLTWPVTGWATKWVEIYFQFRYEPDRVLTLTTLLVQIALSVQLVYVALRPDPKSLWWRLGAAYGVLLLMLGHAVWEGHPGAVARVLLPLSLAFNVLVVRRRAAWGWLILGNVGIFSGLMAFSHVIVDQNKLTDGRSPTGVYLVHTDQQWYHRETLGRRHWIWCRQQGGLTLDVYPLRPTASLRVSVKGFTPRPLEISQDGKAIWTGEVGTTPQWIHLPAVRIVNGRARVELSTTAPPLPENASPTARELGIAVYGVKVD